MSSGLAGFSSTGFGSTDFGSTDFGGVDFAVCEAFRVAIDHDEPVCAACGHLADDHVRPAGTLARLPRRRPVPRDTPARKAS